MDTGELILDFYHAEGRAAVARRELQIMRSEGKQTWGSAPSVRLGDATEDMFALSEQIDREERENA